VRWLAVLVIVASMNVARAGGLLSPGPLANAHASIDGDNDCGKCHESGNQVVARLCLDCHKDLGAEMAAGRGLHGKQYKNQGCESCHVDHVGRGAKLVRWPGGGMEKLDHGLTGYALEGGHTKPKCLDCHKKTSPLGKSQFLGTTTACGACHKDPHAGKLGADCQKCHAVVREWQAFDKKAFDHKAARFELTGKHVDVACEKCHPGAPPKWKPLEFATCESCHADPHKGQFKPKACSACHDTKNWQGATDSIRRNHPKLSLANGHSRVGCKSCHDRGDDKPPSKGSTCASCHAQVHVAKFGNKCESCHASIKWVGLPESIGRDSHAKTRYALAGKHAEVACAGCHKPTKPQAQRFRGTEFGTCNACHADVHKGEFTGLGGRKTVDCAQCHTVQGYTPTSFGLAEHASTSFALDGKHAATPCGACHTGARPRVAFKVANKQCADCHANPHGTQFDKEMQQGGCAHCHTATDWHQAKVDHSTWPLLGAHSRTPCAQCHGEQKKGAEPAAYRGIPRDCEGCHDDIHAGQFTQTQPAKRCQTCHTAETFKIANNFDHTKTRYPLDGKHLLVACGECHKPETLRSGATAVRYRLGYTQCKDCHANPHREAPQ
jgi:hypothetical protein